MMASILIASAFLTVLAFLGWLGWRSALLGVGVSLLVAGFVVFGAVALGPRSMNADGRRYIFGQHVVAAMDIALVGIAAVAVGAAAGLLRRRLASREPS